MKRIIGRVVIFMLLMCSLGTWSAWSQTAPWTDNDGVRNTIADRDIPAAALQTDEGRQLASQLLNLRRSESTMGKGHPSRNAVLAEIAAVKRRLATFATTSTGANDPSGETPPRALPEMSDEQLRTKVLQLSEKLEQLERRIFVLERRLGTIEQ